MSGVALQLEGVGHAYGAAEVVTDVSLEVHQGELVSLLGTSGAGKSTLLRAVGGFLTPTRGIIRVRGDLVAERGRERVPAERRGIGMVFQDYVLFPHLDVAENIAFGLHGVARGERDARVAELLALVGLEGRDASRPAELSGGQQQRVALARALAPRPGLLLLDEPFANLDAELRRELGDELRGLLATEGVAGLLVTHDHSAALAIADRVAVLAGSPATIAQCDTPEIVYRAPASEAVARLTGEAFVVEAEATGASATSALGDIQLRRPAEGAVRVIIRPEAFRFTPSDDGAWRIVARAFGGASWRLVLDGPGGRTALPWTGDGVPALHQPGRLSVAGACEPIG